MTKKIAIIGGGIVGSTAAYYLTKNKEYSVTLFDEGTGQATSASAGIISPWLSQRRNKEWYFLARNGAKFYHDLIQDLEQEGYPTSQVYRQTGTILYKKNAKLLDKLYHLANERLEEAPEIGTISYLSPEEVTQRLPLIHHDQPALFITGGAKVDGGKLIATLQKSLAHSPHRLIKKQVTRISYESEQWLLTTDTQSDAFDELVLATGAWLPSLLEPLGFSVDIRPQKGQLIGLNTADDLEDSPVVMPVGECDMIPFSHGQLLIGATHENEQGYDLTPDKEQLQLLKEQAQTLLPSITDLPIEHYRVGTRAYTSDFSPFFGEVSELPHLLVASGLGSSGLTTGPIIGKTLADWVEGKTTDFETYKQQPNRYIDNRLSSDQ